MPELIEKLRRKMAEQNSDLVNKAGVDPLLLFDLLVEQAIAVAVHKVEPATVALRLREHAARAALLGTQADDGPSA